MGDQHQKRILFSQENHIKIMKVALVRKRPSLICLVSLQFNIYNLVENNFRLWQFFDRNLHLFQLVNIHFSLLSNFNKRS